MQTKHKRTVKVLSASALALGMIVSLDASAVTSGIAGTRHNLGSSNRTASGDTTPSTYLRAGDIYNANTAEICVFCHTPHASNTTVTAPLWNKSSGSLTNYTAYSSGTMQGTAQVVATSMSLACLSCHDGTQAMDNMINAPSSGWTGTAGNHGSAGYNTNNSTAGTRLGGNWYAGVTLNGGTKTNPMGALSAAVYMELGTDLSNDHPIGMSYCGGGTPTAGSNSGCADPDFNAVQAGPSSSFVVGSYTGTNMKKNMRLYGTSQLVECGSCHDPHNDTNTSFLRVSNAGSAVCLTCHVK